MIYSSDMKTPQKPASNVNEEFKEEEVKSSFENKINKKQKKTIDSPGPNSFQLIRTRI